MQNVASFNLFYRFSGEGSCLSPKVPCSFCILLADGYLAKVLLARVL